VTPPNVSVFLAKYHYYDQTKEGVMDELYNIHGREEYYTQALRGRRDGKNHFTYLTEEWEANTKTDLKEIIRKHVDQVNQAQGHVMVVGFCEHGAARLGSIKCLEFLEYVLLRNSYLAT
jgi:hypothetical protein